jgi:hypothetical protein
MSGAETAQVQRGLRTPIEADAGPSWRRVIHVGQPLGLGPRTVLRVCASASHVNAIAQGMAQGAAFDDAFAPIGEDLNALFAKLAHLVAGMGAS